MQKILLLASGIFSFSLQMHKLETDTLLGMISYTDPSFTWKIAIPNDRNRHHPVYIFLHWRITDGRLRAGRGMVLDCCYPLDTVGNPGVLGSDAWSNFFYVNQNLWYATIFMVIENAVFHWKSRTLYKPALYVDGYSACCGGKIMILLLYRTILCKRICFRSIILHSNALSYDTFYQGTTAKSIRSLITHRFNNTEIRGSDITSGGGLVHFGKSCVIAGQHIKHWSGTVYRW